MHAGRLAVGAGDRPVDVGVEGQVPLALVVPQDALEFGVPGIDVEALVDLADLEIGAPVPVLAVGMRRDVLDPHLVAVDRELVVPEVGQRQVEAELDVPGQAVGPLRRHADAVDRLLLARVVEQLVARGHVVDVGVQAELARPVQVVLIDLDLLVRRPRRAGREQEQNRRGGENTR